MIHDAEKKGLYVWHIAGNMKRDILSIAGADGLVTRQHAAEDDHGDVRSIALPYNIFSGCQMTSSGPKFQQRSFVRREERGMLSRLAHEQFSDAMRVL
jgi:hypothetical protein